MKIEEWEKCFKELFKKIPKIRQNETAKFNEKMQEIAAEIDKSIKFMSDFILKKFHGKITIEEWKTFWIDLFHILPKVNKWDINKSNGRMREILINLDESNKFMFDCIALNL